MSAEDDLRIDDDEPISLEPESEDENKPIFMAEEPEEEPEEVDEEPLTLVEEPTGEGGGVQAIGAAAAKAVSHKKDFKRSLNITGSGATRCRVFHSKVADSSLLHMENMINEWIDSEEIEVKHVGHLTGTMVGKKAEENVIVVVWY
jgi:hypothetical protein